MLTKVLVGLAGVIVALTVAVASRTSKFHVERSITIGAPPERPFAQVNDFHRWSAWYPYEKLDPHMTRTFDGPTAGPGATYAWAGDEPGAGKMTIVESDHPSRIQIRLDFVRPMAATHQATFTFARAEGGATRVTWAMDGDCGVMGKAMSLVTSMDRMIGDDFARGLEALKAASEGSSGEGERAGGQAAVR